MKTKDSPIADLWSREYSSQLRKNVPYSLSEQFQKLAAVFSPGMSYYYVMNLQNLHLEYISPEVENITGITPENATIQELLTVALQEDVPEIVKKEMVIKDFYRRYLATDDLTSYKIVYCYRMQDRKGNFRHILHQAVALSLSEEGRVQHVISIHSDITHLNLPVNQKVSFISLDPQKKSYFNVDTQAEKFQPDLVERKSIPLIALLSDREQEVLNLLAKGHNAEKIGKMLHLSIHTIRTHRKNMLKKSGCANTTEMVAQALMEGMIS